MSGRHQNTTWKAIDTERLAALESARSSVDTLREVLAVQPANGEDSVHAENCLAQAPTPSLRNYVLDRAYECNPPKWAGELAPLLIGPENDKRAHALFQDLCVAEELYSYGHCYWALIHYDPAYRARFLGPKDEPTGLPSRNQAVLDAFGGTPVPNESDLREALCDAHYSPERVSEIAAELQKLEVPTSFPRLACTLPHAVEAFTVCPDDLPEILERVRQLFLKAAEQGLAVDVHWHPNP
jgi:hypothetical protein